jgi:hypothetical protein
LRKNSAAPTEQVCVFDRLQRLKSSLGDFLANPVSRKDSHVKLVRHGADGILPGCVPIGENRVAQQNVAP